MTDRSIFEGILPEESSYDPRGFALVEGIWDEFSNESVEVNREAMIPFGVDAFDKAIYGMNRVTGEFILVQSQEKNRKTTFVINTIINMMMHDPNRRPMTVIDVLESAMNTRTYRDAILVNLAGRWMMDQGHLAGRHCPICGGACKELTLSFRNIRLIHKSKTQMHALEYAVDEFASWPIHLYGAGLMEGTTRRLTISANRWSRLVEKFGAEVLVSDHVQQYYDPNKPDETAYARLERAIPVLANTVAEYHVIGFCISQVSLGSVKEAQSGQGKLTAMGGAKGAAEGSIIISTKYAPDTYEMMAKLENSRYGGNLPVTIGIDKDSGAQIRGDERVGI